MKKTFTLLTILAWTTISFAQMKQQGITVLQNSGKTPIAGVQITATGSAPASSDNAGRFSLYFPKSNAGEMLFINEIYKEGYTTINERELKRWILSGEKALPIILCKKEILIASQEKYYGIGKTNYLDRYNRAVEELEKRKRDQAFSEEEYNKRLKIIADEYSQAMTQLENFSYIMAGFNKDDLTSIEQEAFVHIDKGEVSKGIEIIENAKLLDKFEQLSKLENQTQEDIDKMIPSLRHYADLCMFDAGEKNLQRAKDIYQSIALSDTTNYIYARDYGEFLANNLFDFTNSKEWLERSLRCAKNDFQQAESIMGLAIIETYLSNYNKAILYYQKSEELLNKIQNEEKDIDLNEAYVSMEIGCARLYTLLKKYDQASQACLSAIKYGKMLYDKNPEKYAYYYAYAYHESASVMSESRTDLPKAISYFAIARDVFRKVPLSNKLKAMQMIAGGYVATAATYSRTRTIDKVKQYSDSALVLTTQYMEANPNLFAPIQADALTSLGTVYCATGQISEGIKLFKQALAMYDSPQITPNHQSIVQALYYLCYYFHEIKDKHELEQCAVKTINLYNKVLNNEYNDRLATCYLTLTITRYELKKYPQMEESLLKLLQYISRGDPNSAKFNFVYMEPLYNFMFHLYNVTESKDSKNKSTVLDLYKNILKHYPSSAKKNELTKKIQQL